MIISHRHRFIFFAVPKTGTHAMRQAIGPHLGDDDWEQQELFERRRLPIPELARLGHGHISVRQLKPLLPGATWDGYFKFAIVRNPYDRFVSICFFLLRTQPQFQRDATSFMKRALRTPRFRQRILVRPQSALLTDETGTVPLDHVGRFEDLQTSCDQIFEHIGLPAALLTRRNVSQHQEYTKYYDDCLRSMVADFYRADFETFGYKPETSRSQ